MDYEKGRRLRELLTPMEDAPVGVVVDYLLDEMGGDEEGEWAEVLGVVRECSAWPKMWSKSKPEQYVDFDLMPLSGGVVDWVDSGPKISFMQTDLTSIRLRWRFIGKDGRKLPSIHMMGCRNHLGLSFNTYNVSHDMGLLTRNATMYWLAFRYWEILKMGHDYFPGLMEDIMIGKTSREDLLAVVNPGTVGVH